MIRRSNKDSSRHGDEPRASRLPRLTPSRADEPVSLSLRDIVPPPPPQEAAKPADDGLVISDAEIQPVPWLGDPQAELDDQRAARRAQVRRDRLQHTAEMSAAEERASATRAAELRAADVRSAEERAAQARAAEQRAADVRAAQEQAALARAEEARLAAAAAEQAKTRLATEAQTDRAGLQQQLKAQMQAQVRAAQTDIAEQQAAAARAAAERAAQARAAEQRAAEARAAAEREAQARAAAVREAAEREAAAAAARAEAAPETLVLSAADSASSPLCRQLSAFGFRVLVMRQPPQLPAPWPFVAVFVDRALDGPGGGDAIDLCNHVRETSRLPGERKPVLMLVADQLSSTDRVRAGLAGCNELIVGEITRGAVAGALDRRGIVLPSDARRV